MFKLTESIGIEPAIIKDRFLLNFKRFNEKEGSEY